MASKVQIANSALDIIGQAQIMSLDDPTAAARKCKLHIDDAIREVLASGKWTSARKMAQLSQLADEPAFGWSLAYQLPGDYISIATFNDIAPSEQLPRLWEVRGRVLYTNETSVDLVYICDLTANGNDVNAASPLLTECFALKLATKLAWAFQQSDTLRQGRLAEYDFKKKQALAADAREARRPLVSQLATSNWALRDRYCSTNG